MSSIKAIALIMFILMYVVMIVKTDWRLYAIWIVAAVYIAAGVITRSPLYILGAINWNVLMMIGGTMVIVWFFIESKMPNRLADMILDKCPNVMWVIILMSLFSGAVSAFIDNVATVLMIAPVVLAICKKLRYFSCFNAYFSGGFFESAGCGNAGWRYDIHHAWRLCGHELHGVLLDAWKSGYFLVC